jgi:hypothetical protein
MFVTVFTKARHRFISWANYIHHKIPQPISPRSILIQSFYLRLGLPSGLFPPGFPTKTLHTFVSSPMRATCPAHLILVDLISLILSGEEYKIWSSSLCNFFNLLLLHPSLVQIFSLGPCSQILSLCSSLNVRDQVSHPHKTGRIMVLYILTFNF